jgi:hypothetical protein
MTHSDDPFRPRFPQPFIDYLMKEYRMRGRVLVEKHTPKPIITKKRKFDLESDED